jgi:hypothetical protein
MGRRSWTGANAGENAVKEQEEKALNDDHASLMSLMQADS